MTEPIRVVLADDHPLFREGVAHSLGAEDGIEVIAQTGSGEEAVELVQRLRPNVVLLDIEMPGIGGIAAAGRIAAGEHRPRIIMLTVSEDRDSLLAALKAGAHGYILKGVSASELRMAVRRVAAGEAYITPALAAELLFEFSRPPASDPLCELSARETEILRFIGEGLTNREIGEQLHLAEKTVKHYVTVILQKLHVRSRTEAAVLVARRESPARPPAPGATPDPPKK